MAPTFNTPIGRVEAVPKGRGLWEVFTKPDGDRLGDIELEGRDYLATPTGKSFHVCASLRAAVEFLGGA